MAMNWQSGWKSVRRALDREALLRQLGLEERSPAGDFFTGLGLFSVGVLVGAGLGLMFAPKRGEDFRAMMGEAWRNRGARGNADQPLSSLGAEAAMPPTGAGTSAGIGH
jgi:hypothetical protein